MFEALYIIYLSDNPVHTTAQLILHTNHFQVHAFLFPFVINAELYWTINWNRLLLWRRYDLFKLRFILVHFSSWRCNVSRNWNMYLNEAAKQNVNCSLPFSVLFFKQEQHLFSIVRWKSNLEIRSRISSKKSDKGMTQPWIFKSAKSKRFQFL